MSEPEKVEAELAAFERGEVDLASFSHREHVRMAFELLERHTFLEALDRFARALRFITARANKADVYHVTITVAFLALIAQRRAESPGSSWEDFIVRNSDLGDKKVLERWYDPAALKSPVARTAFVLPAAGREVAD